MSAVFLVIVVLVIFFVGTAAGEETTAASAGSLLLLLGLGMLGLLTMSSFMWSWFVCHRVRFRNERGQETIMLIRPSSTSNLFVRAVTAHKF